jgi:hypothetical protein
MGCAGPTCGAGLDVAYFNNGKTKWNRNFQKIFVIAGSPEILMT